MVSYAGSEASRSVHSSNKERAWTKPGWDLYLFTGYASAGNLDTTDLSASDPVLQTLFAGVRLACGAYRSLACQHSVLGHSEATACIPTRPTNLLPSCCWGPRGGRRALHQAAHLCDGVRGHWITAQQSWSPASHANASTTAIRIHSSAIVPVAPTYKSKRTFRTPQPRWPLDASARRVRHKEAKTMAELAHRPIITNKFIEGRHNWLARFQQSRARLGGLPVAVGPHDTLQRSCWTAADTATIQAY